MLAQVENESKFKGLGEKRNLTKIWFTSILLQLINEEK